MKRLAIFLDGTWNDPVDKTSVFRMASNVVTTGNEDPHQRVYYGQGVGTRGYDKLRGGVLGKGLYDNLQDAYEWLIKNYDDGDQVYIFGFSRGAYAARSLAGLIAKCGLIERDAGHALTTAQIYTRYQKDKGVDPIYALRRVSEENSRILSPDELALLKHSRRIPIEMIGVWDTVGSLGVPWTSAPLLGRKHFYFHNTNPSRLYRHAFQALALDEHRGPYAPTLWTNFTPDQPDPIPEKPWHREQLEQRWFIGAHSDVGGGYRDGILDRLPMAWLQGKATHLGLQFKSQVRLDGSEISQPPTDSFALFLKGAYRAIRLGRRFFRPIGRGSQKVTGGTSIPINEVVDASVFVRWQEHPTYRPKNLTAWAARSGRNLETVVGDQIA